MKKYFLLCIFFGLKLSLFAQYECVIDDSNEPENITFNNCNNINLTLDEILSLPSVNFKLAFHFKANTSGVNFTCDPNDPIVASNSLLFAPNFVNEIIQEMNNRMSSALLLNGQNKDTKIRFSLANGGGCNSIFFYQHNQPFNNIPDAININFVNNPNRPGIRGSTNYGSNSIAIQNVLSALLNGSNNTWDIARLINHEFGHTRNLRHAFNCNNPCDGIDIVVEDECCGQCWPTDSESTGCWGCSSRNLMMAYGTQLNFTECEMGQIWNFVINNPKPYQELNLCEENNTSTEIVYDLNTYEIWDQKKVFNKDIRIKSGTTIEVKCDVLIGNSKKIFVENGAKLIINEGRISNLCDDKWAGIKVAGGNSDFDIEVKNGAIIENTSQAAITMWPTSSSYPGNGIARIENSSFNNVRGAVGFFARTSKNNNPSFVRNCIINNARWGISNNNCQNIEVSGNTFNNIELECIFGSMGSYHIFNNAFNSGEQDILFMNTSPSLSSLIENNTFNGRNTGYHADGSVFAQNRIEWNQFYNGQIDILNDGHNSFLAWHNMSHAGLGGVSFSNGNTAGEYAFNTFNNNFIAQLPVGDNPGFNFYENCYTSSFADVYIDGSVSPVIQQGFGDAANNCFTHQGNSSLVFDLAGNPAPFTYVEPNNHNVDCRDAINAHSNVVIDKTGTPGPTPECFNSYTTPPTVPFSPCNPQEGQEEAAKQWLLNKISEIENNPNLTDDQKEKLLSIYRNCLKKVIGRLAEILIEAGDYNGARALYQPESSDDDKVMVYGLYIVEGDIVSANNYLNGFSSVSGQMMDFKTVQQSNLQRILSGYTYEPSTTELATIRTIAEKDHPYAAYAKALFYAYTGEVIVSQMPHFVQQELSNRSKKQFDNDKTVTINPNPFREQLNIILEGLDDPQIYIYDILGSTQSLTFTEDYTTINTSNWSEGVYVVKVYDGSELIKTQKVVLVK